MSSCRRILLTVLLVLITIVSMRWVLGPLWHHGPDWAMWGGPRFNPILLANARSALVWGGSLVLATVALHRRSRTSQLFVRAAAWATMLDSLGNVLGRLALGNGQDLAWVASRMLTVEIVSHGILLLLSGTVLLLMGRHGLDSAPDGAPLSVVRFSGLLALASVLVGAVGILGLARSVGLVSSIGGALLGLLLVVTAQGLAQMRVWALASYVLLTTVMLGRGVVELAAAVQGLSLTRFARNLDVSTLLIPTVLVLQFLVVVPVILAITRGYPVSENQRREHVGFVVTQIVIVLLMAVGAALIVTACDLRLPG